MPYQMGIPTRAAWQKLRDNAKVPKGAAKVSIGDSIEKVHKSFQPTSLSVNIADTKKLIANLESYIKDTKTKHPKFEAVVRADVLNKATAHLAFLDSVIAAQMAYYNHYSAAKKIYDTISIRKARPQDLVVPLTALKHCIETLAPVDEHLGAALGKVQTSIAFCGTGQDLGPHKNELDQMFASAKPAGHV